MNTPNKLSEKTFPIAREIEITLFKYRNGLFSGGEAKDILLDVFEKELEKTRETGKLDTPNMSINITNRL